MPPQRPSLAGVPLLTPQEVTARSIERTNATRAAEIQGQTDLARRILPQLQTIDKDFTIKDALDFVVNKQFQRTGAGSGAAFQAIPGSTVQRTVTTTSANVAAPAIAQMATAIRVVFTAGTAACRIRYGKGSGTTAVITVSAFNGG